MKSFGEEPPTEHHEVDAPIVPEAEIVIDFVRSSGPGGQNVNKTATKAQLRWCIGTSTAFTDEQKALIRHVAGNRLNLRDEIIMTAQTERSQPQNRTEVIAKLQALIREALTPKKERLDTEVSYGQKEKRRNEKQRTGERKRLRKRPDADV